MYVWEDIGFRQFFKKKTNKLGPKYVKSPCFFPFKTITAKKRYIPNGQTYRHEITVFLGPQDLGLCRFWTWSDKKGRRK